MMTRFSLVSIVFLALAACSNQSAEKLNTDTLVADSVAVQKQKLTKIYTEAISKFINAVNKNQNAGFDSLFFGKRKNGQPDDFPDIELPDTINGTNIFLLNPEESNSNKTLYRKSSPYINLIGWVDNEKAEFTFVVFFPEFQHQYDYHINFKYNTAQKEFELEQIAFEDYFHKKGEKPERVIIYKDRKYSGN